MANVFYGAGRSSKRQKYVQLLSRAACGRCNRYCPTDDMVFNFCCLLNLVNKSVSRETIFCNATSSGDCLLPALLPDQKGVGQQTSACQSASLWTASSSARQTAHLSASISTMTTKHLPDLRIQGWPTLCQKTHKKWTLIENFYKRVHTKFSSTFYSSAPR